MDLKDIEILDLPLPGWKSLKVLRLDRNHEMVSGNKLYKLKPWIKKARSSGSGLLSCGGVYSNHLHALAAAGNEWGIKTAAIVRGLQQENPTVTMQDCMKFGMQLFDVTRESYTKRYEPDFPVPYLAKIKQQMLWVPEGGTSLEGVTACEEIGQSLNTLCKSIKFDAVWLAVGSGGTLAGISRSLDLAIPVYAVPVMGYWKDVRQRVEAFLDKDQAARIFWLDKASYGGFGRSNQQQLAFFADAGK